LRPTANHRPKKRTLVQRIAKAKEVTGETSTHLSKKIDAPFGEVSAGSLAEVEVRCGDGATF
jgi:hypothetical protein